MWSQIFDRETVFGLWLLFLNQKSTKNMKLSIIFEVLCEPNKSETILQLSVLFKLTFWRWLWNPWMSRSTCKCLTIYNAFFCISWVARGPLSACRPHLGGNDKVYFLSFCLVHWSRLLPSQAGIGGSLGSLVRPSLFRISCVEPIAPSGYHRWVYWCCKPVSSWLASLWVSINLFIHVGLSLWLVFRCGPHPAG